MSAISLNLADVRNLILALGKERPETVGPREALDIIASGLGVSSKYLTTYSDMPRALDEVGLPLYKNRLINLVHLVSTIDTSIMKNTKRLELLAGVFDRAADAMMHKLKSSEATQGPHPSLIASANPLPVTRIDDVTFDDILEWKVAINHQDGLYVVAGNPWATRSVVDPTLSQMVLDHKVGIAAFNFSDFDLLHPMRDSREWKEKVNGVVQQAVRSCQIVCFYGARDVWDMDIAIECGRKVCTFVTANSREALEGVRHLAGKVDSGDPERGVAVTALEVVDLTNSGRFTSRLSSRLEVLSISGRGNRVTTI